MAISVDSSRGRKTKERAKPDDPVRASLTPERWTEAATEVLADHGIDSVRVDVLARTLGVTRGSFYWHFRDREDLLRSVLRAWRQHATEALTARLERASTDPVEQIRDVISLPFRGKAAVRAARIELAIRAWARRDDMARQAVDEADGSRMGYIAQIFSSMGFPIVEARWRAFVLYSYVVAESVMSRDMTAPQREERNRFVERLIQMRAGA
ncbi:TetR/AcrR family transcriptional regulator [Piscinibacter sp. XHJ-5]|uniref:TetR/AcrR family transcriptional regulator n=1 Tax=Piscinibacter sp. XHJ-5 TaxID=3037797 RepID=UPI0024534E3E|nr:TetR/AcrR family transcriptional regulator [Piscinibacter sp. XHJ-5]